MQRGDQQLAAAFFVYGPQTTLYLTTGQGTDLYRMDPASGLFILVESGIKIPVETSEYAINASNARHWLAPVQRYLSEMLLGADGPRDRDFNMRWTASLVADAARIFNRGGIFLYPRDRRSKYENGRLRLMYEANPISLLVEQAGGAATDGVPGFLRSNRPIFTSELPWFLVLRLRYGGLKAMNQSHGRGSISHRYSATGTYSVRRRFGKHVTETSNYFDNRFLRAGTSTVRDTFAQIFFREKVRRVH